MNRFFSLPGEILRKIYEYDDTYRTVFKNNVLKKNNYNHAFYRDIMEKKFSENNRGTILTIINHLYFNCLERVISNEEINKIKQYTIEKPLGITIQVYKYLLLTDEIPYFTHVPEYICMYSGGITINEFLHKIINKPFYHYFGWIYIYENWTSEYDNSLCHFENMTRYEYVRDDEYKLKDYSLNVFVKKNFRHISNCKMAIMNFMGNDIILYQTEQELYVILEDNEMSMTEREKERDFNKLIVEINKLLNI